MKTITIELKITSPLATRPLAVKCRDVSVSDQAFEHLRWGSSPSRTWWWPERLT